MTQTQSAIPGTQALRDLWRQVSRQHLALGASCGCGFGFSIGIGDLETDICEFLTGKLEEKQDSDASRFLEHLRAAGSLNLSTLLTLTDTQADPSTALFVRKQLAMSLSTFAQAHGRSTFVCD
ncbi:MAG: hypothetical protein FJX29_15805 [Alphaproteobacteria bacterium]|nr:hypothetical protein [Alphaproteobacteria bacterium]